MEAFCKRSCRHNSCHKPIVYPSLTLRLYRVLRSPSYTVFRNSSSHAHKKSEWDYILYHDSSFTEQNRKFRLFRVCMSLLSDVPLYVTLSAVLGWLIVILLACRSSRESWGTYTSMHNQSLHEVSIAWRNLLEKKKEWSLFFLLAGVDQRRVLKFLIPYSLLRLIQTTEHSVALQLRMKTGWHFISCF